MKVRWERTAAAAEKILIYEDRWQCWLTAEWAAMLFLQRPESSHRFRLFNVLETETQ